MPFVLALALTLAAVVVILAAVIPLSLVMRYRVATTRRRLRPWVATVNVVGFWLSAMILLFTAWVTSLWLPEALPYVATGLGIGVVLGLLGVAMSRWEDEPEGIYVTANRLLILLVVVVVVARIGYGVWRVGSLWGSEGAEGGWMARAGVAGSMAAGAILVGHSLAFWAGVRFRMRRIARRTADRETT